MSERILLLDNVRSAYNVGAIFRTADAAGVAKIYLLGYTPAPLDRFGRAQPEITKTSLGASESVPWQSVSDSDAAALLTKLKTDGYAVVSVELMPGAVSLEEFVVPDKVAYIVGNEVDGVQSGLLALSDQVVAIPMRGQKESLNVSVATGVILYKE